MVTIIFFPLSIVVSVGSSPKERFEDHLAQLATHLTSKSLNPGREYDPRRPFLFCYIQDLLVALSSHQPSHILGIGHTGIIHGGLKDRVRIHPLVIITGGHIWAQFKEAFSSS